MEDLQQATRSRLLNLRQSPSSEILRIVMNIKEIGQIPQRGLLLEKFNCHFPVHKRDKSLSCINIFINKAVYVFTQLPILILLCPDTITALVYTQLACQSISCSIIKTVLLLTYIYLRLLVNLSTKNFIHI